MDEARNKQPADEEHGHALRDRARVRAVYSAACIAKALLAALGVAIFLERDAPGGLSFAFAADAAGTLAMMVAARHAGARSAVGLAAGGATVVCGALTAALALELDLFAVLGAPLSILGGMIVMGSLGVALARAAGVDAVKRIAAPVTGFGVLAFAAIGVWLLARMAGGMGGGHYSIDMLHRVNRLLHVASASWLLLAVAHVGSLARFTRGTTKIG